MQINGLITLKYKSEESTSHIYNSLEIDNENYVDGDISGSTIDYKIRSESLGTFLATVDDLIASEIVAEKILENTK
jgi:hypothetical protein